MENVALVPREEVKQAVIGQLTVVLHKKEIDMDKLCSACISKLRCGKKYINEQNEAPPITSCEKFITPEDYYSKESERTANRAASNPNSIITVANQIRVRRQQKKRFYG